MAVTWERYAFNKNLSPEQRQNWYLQNFGDFIVPFENGGSSTAIGADTLLVSPYKINGSGTDPYSKFVITVNIPSSTTNPNISSVILKNESDSTVSGWNGTNAQAGNAETLYFDRANIGGIKVLRLTKQTPTSANTVLFAKDDNARYAAQNGANTKMVVFSMPFKNSTTTAYHNVGNIGFLTHRSTREEHWSSSTTSGNIQLCSENIDWCDYPILNRYAVMGCITNFYTYDGTSSLAPILDTEFTITVNGRQSTFYSLGHGLCIREN